VPDTILVATDLSSDADEAIRLADERARAAGADLVVLHVLPSLLRSAPLFPQANKELVDLLPQLLRRAAETVGRRVTELTGREPGAFRVIVDEGAPQAEIVRRAEGVGARLIVVGGRGETALHRVSLGKVADFVVRYAHCPVLVVRPGRRTGKILAATDFSDPSLPAVAEAAEEARRTSSRLTVLHSLELDWPMAAVAGWGAELPIPLYPREAVEEMRAAADARLVRALEQHHIDGDRRVDEGVPEYAIISAAEELDADLIVVGTIGRTGLKRLVLGSTAEAVVRMAHCSVLVVRLTPSSSA
jgi:nucleotide-binding universal stress UspA family protein